MQDVNLASSLWVRQTMRVNVYCLSGFLPVVYSCLVLPHGAMSSNMNFSKLAVACGQLHRDCTVHLARAAAHLRQGELETVGQIDADAVLGAGHRVANWLAG
jgi:hypothetical protein